MQGSPPEITTPSKTFLRESKNLKNSSLEILCLKFKTKKGLWQKPHLKLQPLKKTVQATLSG
jgi:hypothetical protein